MRKLAVGIAVASLTLLTACGGDDAPEETTSAPVDSGEATVLTGMVGTAEDPDAFEISLLDESGEPVTTLPAGDYTIEIRDLSAMHNFHLTGGAVDESSTVEEVTDVTWDVMLEAGDYSFACDPHPAMSGEFTVT